ncbi:MAG: hypothetical protein OEV88_13250 [Gammaproteobacteria bacterium]|nr:hypothetical protein [Gammaproteobacteria bacterium]
MARRWLPICLSVLVIVFYFVFLSGNAINVPFADDIFDVLKVLSALSLAEDKTTAFHILLAQHNDHRTLATRLLYWVVYRVSGEINFRQLTFLANLALPLLFISLYMMAKSHKMKFLVLLPAALILFQLRSYGIALWSMAAFAYFYVFFYGFYSLQYLHKVTGMKFLVSVVLASLATFTLASGQVVWLVGLVSLLHQSLVRKQVSLLYSLSWACIGLAVLIAWRSGLETPNTLSSMLTNLFNSPGHHALYALTLLGSAVTESSVASAALVGTTALITLTIFSIRSFRGPDLRLELCCWFIVLSVMAMVFGRSFTSVDYALSSRYSFPSVLLLTTIWVLVAVRSDIKSYSSFMLIVLFTLIYCAGSYSIYAKALKPYLEKRVQMFDEGKYWAWPHPIKETNDIVAQAISLGIYAPPARPLPKPAILVQKDPK